MKEAPRIAIVMGSDSDLPVMESAVKVMRDFDLEFELRVMSAHRSPDATHEFATTAEERGVQVIIAGAGGAAHLAGVIASKTALPVIGVPMPTDRAGGIDSLFSTLQMPRGVPVACMGLGGSGAKNAALLAIQILALSDEQLAESFHQFKRDQVQKVDEANEKVQQWLSE
jgi:5-(carboxyamino)imidazole ribonucleotide mutase